MSKKSEDLASREEAREQLRGMINPGDTVYTILRHCSSSGMNRVIDLVIPYIREVERLNPGIPRKGQKAYTDNSYNWEVAAPRIKGMVTLINNSATSTDYGQLLHLPRNEVRVYETVKVPALRAIGWLAARAMGRKYNPDKAGITVGGCGMDMGFSLVYDLGASIWPKGTPQPHSTRNGQPDSDGGYALNHTWL